MPVSNMVSKYIQKVVCYLVIRYQSGSILSVSQVHKIVSKLHYNCKQTICVKIKIVMTTE